MLIPAARAGKLFGTDGGLMLTLYAAFPADFNLDTPLFARIDALDVPLYCERFERRGRAGAVVHFADIDTDRRAAEFAGKELFLELVEEEQDANDEFYMEDLIGFRAIGKGIEGVVTEYYDSEANPLLEIEVEGHPILVPAVEEFIIHIDFKKHIIKLLLPDGLIEIQK